MIALAIVLAGVIVTLIGTNVAAVLAYRGAVNDFVVCDNDRTTAIMAQHAAEIDRDEAHAAQKQAEAERDQAVAGELAQKTAAAAAATEELADVADQVAVDPVGAMDRVRGAAASVPSVAAHPAGGHLGVAPAGAAVQPAGASGK